MFETSAAIGFAFTAGLMKLVSHYAARDWVTMLHRWETYALVGFGILAVYLTQNAFHAGPIGASQAALVLVDPLVSIAIGIALFGDRLRTSGVRGPLEALSLLALLGGGFLLSHSSVVTMMKGEGEAGADMLTPRFRTRLLRGKPRAHPLPPPLSP